MKFIPVAHHAHYVRNLCLYSQICIKMSPLSDKEKWPYRADDPLEKVQFIRNFIRQDMKR
jgi:hypothetical protein